MRKIRLFLVAVCVLFCLATTAYVVQSTPVLAASVTSTSSKIDATKLTIKLSATKYTYNGKEKKPKVTVKYKGKTVSGDNYTVKYSSGRKLPGTYNVTVAFKGKYTGKKTLTYKIALQAPVVEVKRYTKSVELVWDDTLKSTGYLVYNSNKKLIEKTPNPFCVIDGLNPGRKYIFYVRAYAKINGTNYYSSLIKVETATKPIISGAKTLYVGNSKVFKATATGKITWSSSDKTIATVSSSGKVTALKAGTVTIRAKANGITASYSVTVKKLTISGTKTLYVGGSKTFKTNGTGSIAWSSSDKTIATVSSTGKVKALKAGTVKITAKSNGTKATYTLTVKTPSIKLNKTSSTIEQNKSVTLKATVAPSSMSVKWTSNNSSVAKVSSTGKVTAVAPGTATITATGTYAGKTYKKTCKVVVIIQTDSELEEIFLLSEGAIALFEGETYSLSYTAYPTYILNQSFYWKSSNDKIVSVDNYGNIVAKSCGYATISVYSKNKKYTSNCEVMVKSNPIISCRDFPLHLYSYDEKEYLGKLVTNKYDSYSIWNEYGTYGSKYQSKSIWNEYGDYGSPYRSTSAFNPYASQPPKIVTNSGRVIGYLSANEFKTNGYTILQLERQLKRVGQ